MAKIVIQCSKSNIACKVTPIAVHGLVKANRDNKFKKTLSNFDYILPDGQPIAWQLGRVYKKNVNRICGIDFLEHLFAQMNEERMSLYIFGNTASTHDKVRSRLMIEYPFVSIIGTHADRFREATFEEDRVDIKGINDVKPDIIVVSRGCPLQERWIAEHNNVFQCPVIAIGAALDFYACNLKRAPYWMQKAGLEWLHRLYQEPKRLWRRYLFYNTYYAFIVAKSLFQKRGST